MIFQTMNYVRLKNLTLKYQRSTILGWNDIGIRKSEFVAKIQFLCVFDITFKQKDLLLQYSLKIAYKVHIHLTEGAGQINWVFASNSDLLISISFLPIILKDLRNVLLWVLLDQII